MELPDNYRIFVHKGHYARVDEASGERETWEQNVDRFMRFIASTPQAEMSAVEYEELRAAILQCDVMPSMRAMLTAGPAAQRDSMCLYNCSALAITTPRDFAEILYVLMSGTGVGYSVERHYVDQLPVVPPVITKAPSADKRIVVGDSKSGWCDAFLELLESLYSTGVAPRFDYSLIRPAGSPLKTMGGLASGPEPLRKLFKFTHQLFAGAQGRKLRPIQVHSLVCQIAQIVIVGSVRRYVVWCLSR